MRAKTIPAIAMLALLIVAFTASAVDDCDCLERIADIVAYVNADAFVIDCGNEAQVEASLLFTLGKAVEKHDLGIYDCAVKQLNNFIGKVEALFGAGNISLVAYGDLIGLADAASTALKTHIK
jgi:ABC-type proline/glycine betaine transport system permease subunit